MSLPATYSRRKRQASGTQNDVYVYDKIPQKIRAQMAHILNAGIGQWSSSYSAAAPNRLYKKIVQELRKDKGVFALTRSSSGNMNFHRDFYEWLNTEEDVDLFLDGLEWGLK